MHPVSLKFVNKKTMLFILLYCMKIHLHCRGVLIRTLGEYSCKSKTPHNHKWANTRPVTTQKFKVSHDIVFLNVRQNVATVSAALYFCHSSSSCFIYLFFVSAQLEDLNNYITQNLLNVIKNDNTRFINYYLTLNVVNMKFVWKIDLLSLLKNTFCCK